MTDIKTTINFLSGYQKKIKNINKFDDCSASHVAICMNKLDSKLLKEEHCGLQPY